MPYRSPGCSDVLRDVRAHVTDFSYMTLMDKSAVKQKEYSMLCVHAYQYAVIVKHFFLHTKISTLQYSGKKSHAKHGVIKELNSLTFLKKRHSLLTVNTAIQIINHTTEQQYVQQTCMQITTWEFTALAIFILFSLVYDRHIFENCTNLYQ